MKWVENVCFFLVGASLYHVYMGYRLREVYRIISEIHAVSEEIDRITEQLKQQSEKSET